MKCSTSIFPPSLEAHHAAFCPGVPRPVQAIEVRKIEFCLQGKLLGPKSSKYSLNTCK